MSSSNTPLPTRTKSGRSVNKPVVFVPTIPEPAHGTKRRKSTKTLLAAKCKTCQRETDPANNRIVFCDACNTAYHQYCHRPPIDSDVVTVLEKEWLCSACVLARQRGALIVGGMVAAPALTVEEVSMGRHTHRQARPRRLTDPPIHRNELTSAHSPNSSSLPCSLRPPSATQTSPFSPHPRNNHTPLHP